MTFNSSAQRRKLATKLMASVSCLLLANSSPADTPDAAIGRYADRCIKLMRAVEAERREHSEMSPRKYLWEGRDPLLIKHPPFSFDVGSVGVLPKVKVLAAGAMALVERPGVDPTTYRPPTPRMGTFGGKGLGNRISSYSRPIRIEFRLKGYPNLLNGEFLEPSGLHWGSGAKNGVLIVEPLPETATAQLRETIFERLCRTWKSEDGKFSVKAILAGSRRRGTQIALVNAEGKRATVEADLLCEADRDYVRQWRIENDPAKAHLRDR